MDFAELKNLLEQQNKAISDFKIDNDARFNEIEARMNRKGWGGANDGSSNNKINPAENFTVNFAGKHVQALTKDQRLSSYFGANRSEDNPYALADFVRQKMGISAAVTSGDGTVPTFISTNIIDLVRAASVVIEAGAITIPIEGPTNLAKITGDPTVYQHTEGTEDITESDVSIGAVTTNPKALVAAVPLSAEIVADSPNLEMILQTSLAAAFAGKLDTLCLATILADTNIPTSAAGQDPATWAGALSAVTAALGADQKLPPSYIGSEADFMARAILTDDSGSWLGKPPILQNMLELYTTNMTAGTAVFGDFVRGFAIAVRQGLVYEVVRLAKHKSYSHVLVAHARMDGYVLQSSRLFIQQATVD